ncbi:MAG: acyl carrier protein [Verrucomicrobia bacterium]|nr:acyl carrier protein [Verrucomicrobiota bacterium]
MNEDQILEQLTEIFHQVFDDDSIELTLGTTAADIPEWDSMNHISLIVLVQSHFKIKFQTSELEDLKNVGDFVTLIVRKLG